MTMRSKTRYWLIGSAMAGVSAVALAQSAVPTSAELSADQEEYEAQVAVIRSALQSARARTPDQPLQSFVAVPSAGIETPQDVPALAAVRYVLSPGMSDPPPRSALRRWYAAQIPRGATANAPMVNVLYLTRCTAQARDAAEFDLGESSVNELDGSAYDAARIAEALSAGGLPVGRLPILGDRKTAAPRSRPDPALLIINAALRSAQSSIPHLVLETYCPPPVRVSVTRSPAVSRDIAPPPPQMPAVAPSPPVALPPSYYRIMSPPGLSNLHIAPRSWADLCPFAKRRPERKSCRFWEPVNGDQPLVGRGAFKLAGVTEGAIKVFRYKVLDINLSPDAMAPPVNPAPEF